MFSLEVLIMVSSLALLIGALIGAVISRTAFPPAHEKELEKRLETSRDELNRYQQEVAEHFAETSKLVNNLTQSYKGVHEHLAKGAVQLTSPEISKQMLDAGASLGAESGSILQETPLEPPKDWAPKSPGQTGMLSEEFGLSEDKDDPGIEVLTAHGAPHKRAS